MRRSTAGGLAILACTLGYACGHAINRPPPPLAPAGTPRDDGSGLLARLSARGVAGSGALGAPAGRDSSDGAGHTYGGAAYGAATYGGSVYANLNFDYTAPGRPTPAPYGEHYHPRATVADAGSVAGQVLWPRPPHALDHAPAGPSSGKSCAAGVPNQTLSVGAGGAVANAVVYLDKVQGGRALLGRISAYSFSAREQLQIGGTLEWRGCRFWPHVQVAAPVGSVLGMTAADAAVVADASGVDSTGQRALWSVDLAGPGVTRDVLLEKDGFVELRPRGPASAASAWVVVAPHPYYAVTDEAGRFVLPQVPPGTYQLVVWHEPVVIGTDRQGLAVTTTAVTVRRQVTVRPRKAAEMVIRLPAATGP